MRVVRRTARGIIIDQNGRLVLFRRTLPKRKPYWSTPGGGVDAEDDSVEAALHRELAEELGAVVDRVQQVYLTAAPRGEGVNLQHFFVCRLVSMDLDRRTGAEFSNPAKGRYAVERVDLRGKKLGRYDLQPAAVRDYILANRQVLLTTALADDAPPLMLSEVPPPPMPPMPDLADAAAARLADPADDSAARPADPADDSAARPAVPPILEIVDGDVVGPRTGDAHEERSPSLSRWDRLRRKLSAW